MAGAVWILAALAAMSFLGVMIGQSLPPDAYVERYGRVLGTLVHRSGLSDIFTSWFFLLLAAVLAALSRGLFARQAEAARLAPGTRPALARRVAPSPPVDGRHSGRRGRDGGLRLSVCCCPLPRGRGRDVRRGRRLHGSRRCRHHGVHGDGDGLGVLLRRGRDRGRRRGPLAQDRGQQAAHTQRRRALSARDASVRDLGQGGVVRDSRRRRSRGASALHDREFRSTRSSRCRERPSRSKCWSSSRTSPTISRIGPPRWLSIGHRNPAVLVRISENGSVVDEIWVFADVQTHRDDVGAPVPAVPARLPAGLREGHHAIRALPSARYAATFRRVRGDVHRPVSDVLDEAPAEGRRRGRGAGQRRFAVASGSRRRRLTPVRTTGGERRAGRNRHASLLARVLVLSRRHRGRVGLRRDAEVRRQVGRFRRDASGVRVRTRRLSIVRSVLSGHPPVTNLFEYLSFFAWASWSSGSC